MYLNLTLLNVVMIPTTIVSLLEKGMILEYKYGPPEGYLPVLDYVLEYLREVISYKMY